MTLEGRLSPSLSVGNRSEAEASPLRMIGSPGRIPRDIWQLPPRILGVEALDLAVLASL